MQKKICGNNKGFSLVELIIVIAIMAILVGVMAPQLLKYLEKSRVTSDRSLLNSVDAAVTYASVDKKILDDPVSVDFLRDLVTTPQKIDSIPTNSALYNEVTDSLGWDDLNQSTYISHIKSAHSGSSYIYMQYKGSCDNPIAFWITCTDASGDKDTSENVTDSYLNVTKCVAIK